MNALLSAIRECGGSIWLNGDGIGYRFPKGALGDGLKKEMAQRKDELIEYLRREKRAKSDWKIPKLGCAGKIPLSFGQERMYLLYLLDPKAYNISGCLEIFLSLCNGALLVLPDAGRFDSQGLAAQIVRDGISTLIITPSVLATLPIGESGNLSKVIIGGEPCPTGLMDAWRRRCRLFNAYAPTEGTVFTTFYEVPASGAFQASCIGKPIRNTVVAVLDERMRPAPIGAIGEICLAGHGLARGYWNNSYHTKEVADMIRRGEL